MEQIRDHLTEYSCRRDFLCSACNIGSHFFAIFFYKFSNIFAQKKNHYWSTIQASEDAASIQCSFDINSCRRRLSPSYFKNKYFSIELKLCEILWMCRWNGELYVFTIHFLLAIIQILHTIISFLFKFTILSNFSIYFLRSILSSSYSTSFFHSRVYFSFAKPQKKCNF